ncbi:hypothetical protein KKF81_00755 [Candidatus Micrarchaeota archaeon]|nr:hypothetical protein [Candidatus Micrarchaeota archaeon]MBU1165449.1 hypothetical protein [Candidatus Micrarchaeota archaeon]MBU1887430.1 hypothetical protein [Candidatus Micrarchaeota archaeon]
MNTKVILLFAILALIIATPIYANFLIEKVDVTISDIQSDGSANVHESIKFIIFGDFESSVYDASINSNNLSVWSNNIGLNQVKIHVNTAKVDVQDFRLRPQPRTKCNPIQGVCHGELILDYLAYPSFNTTTSEIVPGTGLFTIEKYKPRTKRYKLNPASFSFMTTADGNIILDDTTNLIIALPQDSIALDVNPQPTDGSLTLPGKISSLSWNDIVLVKFSLIFDVEDSIDKEVSDFFGTIISTIAETLRSPHGGALVVLLIILIGSYLYIIMSKRRGEK